VGSVHLVRHGESAWNRLGRIQGQSPLAGGLTARGWVQASAVAGFLERLLAPTLAFEGARVVSSDLVRARQTAAVIACRLGCSVDLHRGLREQRLGRLEGRLSAAPFGDMLARDVVEALWRDRDARPPGDGESVADLAARAAAAIGELAGAAGASPLVLVAHGGVIRSLCTLLSEPAVTVPNGAVVTLEVGTDGAVTSPDALPAAAGIAP
jgi:probable phosphoglycerate mutase